MRRFAQVRTAPLLGARAAVQRPVAALARHDILGCTPRLHSGVFARSFSDFMGRDADAKDASGRLSLSFAACCLPHPDKVERGGEDSYFACPGSRSFGVADGVGGWADAGVDPGLYARNMLRYAYEDIRKTPDEAEVEADLSHALLSAAERLQESKQQGGSTMLLGQLRGSSVVVMNLGDSGMIVLRPALRTPPGSDQPLLFPRVVFRSSDQTHYFNCPYQLGSSSSGQLETPDVIRIRVRAGDIVVAATDGVFDNLFDHQVQAIVARHLGSSWRTNMAVKAHLQGLATSIAKQAQRVGQQDSLKDVITPFALSAHSEGIAFRGGKLDDTTVVIALVEDAKDNTEVVLRTLALPQLNNFEEGMKPDA